MNTSQNTTYVDANYFLRYIIQDNPPQQAVVEALFGSCAQGKITLFTSTVTIFEIYWVLRSFYKMSKIEIVKILTNILALRFIQLDERSQLLAAVEYYQESSISLEDAYHLAYAQSNQATNIATFDHKLLKIFNQLNKN